MTSEQQPGDRVEQSGSVAHAPREPGNALDRYFEITRRGSTLAREIRGGLTSSC